jgi:hypothetical protein
MLRNDAQGSQQGAWRADYLQVASLRDGNKMEAIVGLQRFPQ